jgi:coenzyme F420 hydrogenase subunit beta
MHGVLHIGADPEDPIRNRTRLSRSRGELLSASGSRYSPASVCNGLGLVEGAPAPCAVIGKPSEIAAVRNARRLRPGLDAKVGVTMSFFCAESPSTRGTLALLEKLGIDSGKVANLRYRGLGWPGHFAPTLLGEQEPAKTMTYRESWAFLQAFRPWSVQMWPDGSGELADISCGDPWYQEPDGRNPGFSLVVARTARGREIVEGAMAAGYLELRPAEGWKLEKSQGGLLQKKGSVWGRRWAMRLLGLPVTRLEGLDLRHCWSRLSLKDKARGFFGTLRRAIARKLFRPLKLDPAGARPVGAPIAERSGGGLATDSAPP